MKKIILTSLLIVFVFNISIAQKSSISVSRNNNEYKLQIKDDAQNIQLNVTGEVSFTGDEKGIEKLSRGASIFYRNNRDRLEITPDESGSLVYTINGTKETSLDATGQKLVASCVQLMIDNGVGAEDRVARIYKQGGFSSVLKEVERLKNDYVKSIYLSYLGANHSLTDDEMLSFLNNIDTYLSSDYYKAELMNGIRANYLKKEVTGDAYLQNVKNIKSDYYQSATVKKILNSSLTDKQYDQVLSIVNSMKSDYYESEILKMLLNNNNISDSKFSQLMNVAAKIKSDYYQSEIISMLLANKSLDKSRYSQTIAAMQNLESGYYKASILKKMIDADVKDVKEWSKLIVYTAKINSDYEKSEVLLEIARKMPASETLKKEFAEAAKSISSDYYYGKVARALNK